MLIEREKLEEAFQALEAGSESFRSLAAKLGVSKSTLQRRYVERLKIKISELKQEIVVLEKAKARLEAEVAKLKGDAQALREEFERRNISVEEGIEIVREVRDLKSQRKKLTEEIEKIKIEAQELQLKNLKLNAFYSKIESELRKRWNRLQVIDFKLAQLEGEI